MDLFGRRYTLTVGTVKIEGAAGRGLRVAFRIHKSLAKDPNTGEIKIFNLSKENRAKLKDKGIPIVFSAGYENTEATIFSGDSRYINHELEGPTWVTKIQCGDGERAYAFTRFNKSYAAGVSVGSILRDAVASTSLNPGNLNSALAEPPRGGLTSFVRGYTAHGRAVDTIETLAKSLGFTVSIQGGAFQFLRNGVAPGAAVLLSPGTGLIGSPTYSSPEKKDQAARLIAKSFLQPQIVCGGQVSIKSEEVNGAFRVQKLDHTGDWQGQEWYTSIEVKAL